MKNKFKVYTPTLAGKLLEGFHAYQIVSAVSADKCIEVAYLNEKGQLKDAIFNHDISLTKLMKEHEDGFIQIDRARIVNKQHLISFIKGTVADGHTYGKCVVAHLPYPVKASRRGGKLAIEYLKEKKCA